MRLTDIRLVGIRSFTDTGRIELSPRCNVFVGRNNVGKSTLLKGIYGFQGQARQFQPNDRRPGSADSWSELQFDDFGGTDSLPITGQRNFTRFALQCTLAGTVQGYQSTAERPVFGVGQNNQAFESARPRNTIVPLTARRKAMNYDENVSSAAGAPVTGTFANLYSQIDRLATAGHPHHQMFVNALREIVELPITTRASANGKQAGMYLGDEANFITLDQMGDGVAEMVGLIVELCGARRKIFVLEEPETNLHPAGLKSLLQLVRTASGDNQFVIATHSNIVVRELGSDPENKVFRVYRTNEDELLSPSRVEEVPRNPIAHTSLLRELGYEFADYGLHDAWLFLEESSAEQIITEILIPRFVPGLGERLRTFSAAGAGNLGPSVSEFQRLVTFVHLQPAYQDRLWVRADNDADGAAAINRLKDTFGYLNEQRCAVFPQPAFERYYPPMFQERVDGVLAIQNKQDRRRAKQDLLLDVLAADRAGEPFDWEQCAADVIAVLRLIQNAIG